MMCLRYHAAAKFGQSERSYAGSTGLSQSATPFYEPLEFSWLAFQCLKYVACGNSSLMYLLLSLTEMRLLTMAPKAKKDDKARNTITMQIKKEITEKHEKGLKASTLVSEYGLPKSTMSTIIHLFILHLFIVYPRLY